MHAQHRCPERQYRSHCPLQQLTGTGASSWIPQDEQAEVFAARPPAPTITVLVKLRPGQAIETEMQAVKGEGPGKDHSKFSPVGAYSLSFF
jgi:hypothetical protein